MSKNLPSVKSGQDLSANIGTTSTLLGRGLATIQNRQLAFADQNARYRKARDTYDRITDYGSERRFDPEILPKPGTQFDLFSDEPINALQPLIDQTLQLREAFQQIKKLADEGYGKAYFVLARIYYGGQGITENKKRCEDFTSLSFQWLINNRMLNDAEIWRDLGRMYFDRWFKLYPDKVDEENLEQAIFWYTKAAENGDAEAQNHLGFMYENFGDMYQFELMGEEGFEQAAYWYRKAAEQGHRDAQYNLSDMYESGKGVEQDDEPAICWLIKAANQGHAFAQFHFGSKQEDYQKYKQAFVSYRKAAEQGLTIAQYKLGTMYENGLGVEQELEQAVFWYRKAAEQGYANAQYNLGCMYRDGLGIDQDYEQAIFWYRKEAEQGDAKSQYKLGLMYANGQLVNQDTTQAVYWFRKAAKQGNLRAITQLEQLGIKD